jgi:hypothetical protein
MSIYEQNARVIEEDFNWLQRIIEDRISNFLLNQTGGEITAPASEISETGVFYANFLQEHSLTPEERIVVLLALAPELQPELLDRFLIRNNTCDKIYSEFGGISTPSFNGFLPTHKTALFVLGGPRLSEQMKFATVLDRLATANILAKTKTQDNSPVHHRQLRLSDRALSYILTGEDEPYEYSPDFPARRLTTKMEWQDLVLHESTAFQLKELLAWPDHGEKLINKLEMGKNIQPGYRALFYGPSGTGKTLTAALIGKRVNKPVYRIDLSQLVSKYVGETEKNLEKIFNAAENRDWILFFDEADALFGKRTGIDSSNDRFANLETAYLLQRIEVCDNIVLLATNLKTNIDEAFTRRFQSIVHFPVPTEAERYRLWWGALPQQMALDEAIDLKEIAQKFDLTGGSIVNVVRYATLMAVSSGTDRIQYGDLMDGIRREYMKLGRTL